MITYARPFVWLLAAALLMTACTAPKKSSGSAPSQKSNAASMQLRKNIVNKAQKYVGTAYKYAGGQPSTGFDCSGFTSFVFKEFNIQLSPASAEQAKQGYKIPLEKVKPGDLIFFGDATRIQHVALVVERTKDGIVCVHSTTSRGVIVENISTSTYWKPKILYARDVLLREK